MSSDYSNSAEGLLVRLAEQQRTKYYGKYRGIVQQVGQGRQLGMITALVPAVYGAETTPWALPAVPFAGPQHGLVLLPEEGDGVWIEFEAGNLAIPIWTGCWWRDGDNPAQSPKARLLATTAGHQVLIDEDADEILLKHPGGAEISMTTEGISLKFGTCELKITTSEINLNNGMVKVTTAGASLVNDAFKVGA
jgi:Type VI secretion system/phage-baseplate injector OB domain